MKELDFLPDWYRADRQRKQRQYRHYVLFGLIVALLAGWSFMLGRSVVGLQAQSRQIESVIEEGRQTLQAAQELRLQIDRLNRETEILEALTPRTTVSAVLGELSHCVNERIMFSRVSLIQESIKDAKTASAASQTGVIRIGGSKSDGPSPLPKEPQQTKITLTGIAAGGADVAGLIERLEISDYFTAVSPAFSRAKKIGDKTVTEFEIICTVADYHIVR
ncbi:MAG TPA: hypothetical protein ENN97_01965 [Phycisphaerales bacterium]|nr:hypothetical protein [Phycisphaerales bacterium]